MALKIIESVPLETLAEFRHQLRRFLLFSERAAKSRGLQPQQHQLLLQIAGAPVKAEATIGYLAERLRLRHHSAVELINRCEAAGLIMRTRNGDDRRRVLLKVSAEGRRKLEALSKDHARELNELAPALISTLIALQTLHPNPKVRRKRAV